MATANLNQDSNLVQTGKDNIVIISALTDLPGGRTLDVSGVASGVTVLKAGHIIIKTEAGEYKPLPVNEAGTAYGSKESSDVWVGVLKTSILVNDPRAAIVTAGQVNAAASPYPVTDTIKSGLPLIQFLY